MFVDKVQVIVQAGDGGDGAVSFRHEKFIDRGGPDGGDGGKGGNVIVRASRNQNTLATFRYQKLVRAASGQPGSMRKKHGKNGKDLYIDLPVGTTIINASGEIIVDLIHDNQTEVLAEGGKGGFGNAHFISSTRQAPRLAEKGEKIEQQEYTLELKMIADVGLIGLPNAGKSTLLSVISNAKPQIADYPFTTVIPNLGVVDVPGGDSLLFADIPGLIEGASLGKGLGDEFLRHIERTKVLVHLIDIYDTDIVASYKTINEELRSYSVDLTKKQQIVVLNKIEGLDQATIKQAIKKLQKISPKGTEVLAISAVAKENIDALLYRISEMVKRYKEEEVIIENETKTTVISLKNTDAAWKVDKQDSTFTVTGTKIEQFARKTDFNNPHGVQRLRDIMRKMGIMHELERRAIEPGQKIVIGSQSIKY